MIPYDHLFILGFDETKMRLSLAAKSLILVSIPLCFEIGFVVVLTNFQKEAEAEAARAREARVISDEITNLSGDFYAAANSLGAGTMKKWVAKGFLDKSYKAIFVKLRAQYAKLEKLSQNKPELRSAVRQSISTLDEIEGILDKGSRDVAEGRTEEIMETYKATSQRITILFKRILSEQLVMAARHEKLYADTSDGRQSAIRGQILHYALIAALTNSLFSVVLAIFIVGNITSRITVMNENARRLAKNQPLNRPLYGNDEIAALDRAFHKMAKSLEEAARSKQDMVNMLTHDLRSPLMSIRGSLEIIDSSEEHGEREKRLVKLADRNSARMIVLINDMLDIQKINSGMMTVTVREVCLAEVFEEVKLGFQDLIKEQNIHLSVEDTALFVKADQEKLDRVLFNLVSNAVKYSPKNGTITLGATESEKLVEVTVSDEGPGIPEAMQKTIFERFHQVDDNEHQGHGGSGLGLFVCSAIVGLLGGTIWVTSEPGKGSTFHLTLPKA